jgi:predicted RNA methylase
MKITLDKYYTDTNTAKQCIEKVYEIIGKENITQIIEPSAGNGSFSLQLECLAYDIAPEADNIIEQDYLELDLPYQKGRLIIGNPPFGSRMNLAQKFFKKSIELGDYIAFILPISQLNNSSTMFEFDLVYSEDLGKIDFSDRNLHCCFNIYKRPELGLNKKQETKLKDIVITRQDSKGYDKLDFDIRMCYWGNGSAGKILQEGEKYSGEYKIKILNNNLKEDIIRVLTTVDWKKELNFIAMLRIKQYNIVEILKKYIPEIK